MSDDNKTVRKVPCEVYSRIVGFIRPVDSWNKGKRQEFRDRTTYDVMEVVNDKSAQESQF